MLHKNIDAQTLFAQLNNALSTNFQCEIVDSVAVSNKAHATTLHAFADYIDTSSAAQRKLKQCEDIRMCENDILVLKMHRFFVSRAGEIACIVRVRYNKIEIVSCEDSREIKRITYSVLSAHKNALFDNELQALVQMIVALI